MFLLKVVLIIQLAFIGFAHWICDKAGTTCDAELGTELCFAHFGNSYVTSHDATLMEVDSRLKCAALCLQAKNCLCILFFNGKKCILLFTTTAADETSGLLFVTGQEIAFGKKTYATTHNSDSYPSSNAVDQHWWGTFYHSKHAVKSWWLVDLGQNYIINEMRINFYPWNTADIHIKFGHTLKTDGDFSSYDMVAVAPGTHPKNSHWYLVIPSSKEQYRYVSIQLKGTQYYHLVINGVHVFAKVSV